MAQVTITQKDGSKRVEDGKGNVISRTPAPNKTKSSSSVTVTSKPVYIDQEGNKKTVTITSEKTTGTKPKEEAEQPQTLPEGAKEITGNRIKYGGATYDKDTFFNLQSQNRRLGIYDSPTKQEAEYKASLSHYAGLEFMGVEETRYPARTDQAGSIYLPIEFYEGDKYKETDTPIGTKEAFEIEGPDIITPFPGYELQAGPTIKREAEEAGRTVTEKNGKIYIRREIKAPTNEPVKNLDVREHEGIFEENTVYAPIESFFSEKSQQIQYGPSEFEVYNTPDIEQIFIVKEGVQHPFISVVPPTKVTRDVITGDVISKEWDNVPIALDTGKDLQAMYEADPELFIKNMENTNKKLNPNAGKFTELTVFEDTYNNYMSVIKEQPQLKYLREGKESLDSDLWGVIASDGSGGGVVGDINRFLKRGTATVITAGIGSTLEIPDFIANVNAVITSQVKESEFKVNAPSNKAISFLGLGGALGASVTYKDTGIGKSAKTVGEATYKAGSDWIGRIDTAIQGGEYETAGAEIVYPGLAMAGSIAGPMVVGYALSAGSQAVVGKVKDFQHTIEGIEYAYTASSPKTTTTIIKEGGKTTHITSSYQGVGDVSLSHLRLKGYKYGGNVVSDTITTFGDDFTTQATINYVGGPKPYNVAYGTKLGTPQLQSFQIWDKGVNLPTDLSFISRGIDKPLSIGVGSNPNAGAVQYNNWVSRPTDNLDDIINARKIKNMFLDSTPPAIDSAEYGIHEKVVIDMLSGKPYQVQVNTGVQTTFLYDDAGKLIKHKTNPIASLTAQMSDDAGASYFGYSYSPTDTQAFTGIASEMKIPTPYKGPTLKETSKIGGGLNKISGKIDSVTGRIITETMEQYKPNVILPPNMGVSPSVITKSTPRFLLKPLVAPTTFYRISDYDGALTTNEGTGIKGGIDTNTGIDLRGLVITPPITGGRADTGIEIIKVNTNRPYTTTRPTTRDKYKPIVPVISVPKSGSIEVIDQNIKPIEIQTPVSMDPGITEPIEIPQIINDPWGGGKTEVPPPEIIIPPSIPPGFPAILAEGETKHKKKKKNLKASYKPSLLGVLFNVKTKKQPKIVTGGGIRPIVIKKKKTKKKRRTKK